MDFTHPHFAEPRWLWLAVVGPGLLLLLQWHAARARRRQIAKVAVPELLGSLLASHSPVRRTLKNALLVLALVGVGCALARPQWGEQAEESRVLGEDLLFLLDCSRSMLAADVRPNRLARAKLAILDFVQRHGRGRLGLIAFAGQAFLQCPLTFDYDAFGEALMAVDDKTIPVPGTDIGRALDEAFAAMEKTDRRKILLLLTDGEDLEKAGIKTAKELGAKGMVVFTVGVGSSAGSAILAFNERGAMEPIRDRSGKIVESRLDERILRAIAEATGGSYHPLGALGEGMNQVRRWIETSADLPGFSRSRKLGVDRFPVPIAAVVILLVSESLIGTRRRLRENQLQ